MANIIDVDELRERLDHDVDFFKEIVDIFIEDIPISLSKLNQHVKDNNIIEIRKTSHAIKGSVANLSGKIAYKIASELEQAAINDNNIEIITDLSSQLKTAIDNLITELIKHKDQDTF